MEHSFYYKIDTPKCVILVQIICGQATLLLPELGCISRVECIFLLKKISLLCFNDLLCPKSLSILRTATMSLQWKLMTSRSRGGGLNSFVTLCIKA